MIERCHNTADSSLSLTADVYFPLRLDVLRQTAYIHLFFIPRRETFCMYLEGETQPRLYPYFSGSRQGMHCIQRIVL